MKNWWEKNNIRKRPVWVIERDELHEFHFEPTGVKSYFVNAIQSGDEKDFPGQPWKAYYSLIGQPLWVQDIEYAQDFETKEMAEKFLKTCRGKIFRNSDKVAQHIWTDRAV